MTIKEIWAKNFLSFSDFSYKFPDHPVRVVGVNKTDANQKSNGSGKSSISEVIEYATKSTNSRQANVKDLIRWGCSKAEVGIVYYCNIRQQTMTIRRAITKSKTELFIDFGDGEKLYSAEDGNSRILEWLDLSKEDLDSYFFINKERFKSFFSNKGKADRLALLGRISDTNIIDSVFPKIADDLKEIEDKIKLAETNRDKLVGKKEQLEEQIEELESPEESKDDTIKLIDENISSLLSQIDSNNKSIQSTQEELLTYEKALKKHKNDKSKLNVDSDLIDELYESVKSIKADLKEAELQLDSVELNLNGAIECPKCHHEFTVKENVDLESEREIKEELDLIITELNSDIKIVNEELSKAEKDKLKLKEIDKSISDVEMFILRANKTVERLELNNVSLEAKIESENVRKEQILLSKPKDNSEQIAILKTKINSIEKDIIDAENGIDKLNEEYSSVDKWNVNFKKFKMFIANKQIATIQNLCNINLKNMGSDLRVKIDGFRTLSNGKDKEEITPLVVREEAASFFSYSGGERGRVEFSMILTIQQLINKTNRWGGLNFLLVDEIFEGVDSDGVKHLMKSIKNIGQTVMLVTHVSDELITNDSILVVEKVNGISRIAS